MSSLQMTQPHPANILITSIIIIIIIIVLYSDWKYMVTWYVLNDIR